MESIKKNYQSVNYSDGIDVSEAKFIAQSFAIKQDWKQCYNISHPTAQTMNTVRSNGHKIWQVTFSATYSENIKQASLFGLLGLYRGGANVGIDKQTGKVVEVFLTTFDL